MSNRHQCYMWVVDAMNIKNYTETLTLVITRAQIVSWSSDKYEKFRKGVAFTLHYITVLKISN